MKKNNMRLLSIVMNEDTKDNRSSDTISMMEYGFSNYGSETIINKDNYKETIVIENANNREVNCYLKDDINVIVNKGMKNIDYTIDKELYDMSAPLNKNSVCGKLVLNYDNNKYEYNLVLNEDVSKSKYIEVLYNIFKDLMSGIKIL